MQAGRFRSPIVIGALLVALAGCDEVTTSGGAGFRTQYDSARDALEAGNFTKANRLYARMVQQPGPLQPRIRLEYAHSLLRSGEYAEASTQARTLADSQTGEARSAALSVYGTAQHELGLAAIDRGDAAAARTHLTTAHAAMKEVISKNPKMDPLGALAGRVAAIEVQLTSLG